MQANGSKYIEIWKSDDLVNWSKQSHVKVSSDYAGNTWAPEAYYDEEIGKYGLLGLEPVRQHRREQPQAADLQPHGVRHHR